MKGLEFDMDNLYKTEQEAFWTGSFGDEYVERNNSDQLLASNISLFSTIISRTERLNSVIEFGANVGMNLKAIKNIIPGIDCAAVEINHKAVEVMKSDPFLGKNVDAFEMSILDFEVKKKYDLSLVKGVLIHINPEELDNVYKKLYESSKQYICIAEYYNPTPVMVNYRGQSGKLFKRDFAGEFLEKYKDTRLVDYGFVYHRDSNFPQDDITWFLIRKINL